MLKNKKVVIIGGSSGIGLETAKAFVTAGASVTLTGRSLEKLDATREAIGDPVTVHAFDGRDDVAVEAFFDSVGSLDHLIIAAGGGGAVGAFHQIDDTGFRAAFDRKFWVHVTITRHAIGRIREGGSITFVTAMSAKRAKAGMAGLAAVNGALNAIIAPLALELAPIRVNAVSPGVIDTPYWDRIPAEQRDTYIKVTAEGLPVRRVGTAQDVAEAILFVVTNGYMTGTIVEIDGGGQLV